MRDDLSELLNAWQPATPEPADFRRGVWTRIEATTPAPGWLEQWIAQLARPRFAMIFAAIAVILGGATGNWIASSSASIDYLRTINPYAAVR